MEGKGVGVGGTMRRFSALVTSMATLAVLGADVVSAQGASTVSVSGQVAILERPGETTEDLGNVVVFLEPMGASARPQSGGGPTNTVIALDKRQFSPRVRVITEGSKVEFPNQDPFSHNVFSKVNGGFDTQTFGRGKMRDHTFTTAGVYTLYCNVHPRMTAFVIALNTPHYTQAGDDGRFTLENVPPGQYRLHVWHDRTSEIVENITVSPRGVRGLRKELDARGYKYVQHKDKFGKVYASGGDRY
jgi:plastocyanin